MQLCLRRGFMKRWWAGLQWGWGRERRNCCCAAKLQALRSEQARYRSCLLFKSRSSSINIKNTLMIQRVYLLLVQSAMVLSIMALTEMQVRLVARASSEVSPE